MPITKVTNKMGSTMFTSVGFRSTSASASAYQRVSVETAVSEASPHQLVSLILDGFLQAVGAARVALARGDVATKGRQIGRAVRMIDEALKPALNLEKGGEIAANLNGLYGFCVLRLTHANLKNDDAALAEVLRVMEPIAQGWKQMGADQGAANRAM
jgi:flagellar protein FliS